MTFEQRAMIAAGILTMYYNSKGDCPTTDKPGELRDAAAILNWVAGSVESELVKHWYRVADLFTHAATYTEKDNIR